MRIEYMSICIDYIEETNKFVIDKTVVGLEEYEFESLKSAKEAVYNFIYGEKKYKPVNALYYGYWNNSKILKKCVAIMPISFTKDTMMSILIKIGEEEKIVNGGNLFLDTPENQKLLSIIESKELAACKLNEEVRNLENHIEILKMLDRIQ